MDVGYWTRQAIVVVASVILGGVVAHFSGWWWWRKRRKYELTYSVIEDRHLADWDPRTGIAGSVDGREIKHPRYLVIRLENTGTEEFAASDFEEPIRFTIKGNIRTVRIGNVSHEAFNPDPLRPSSASVPFGFRPLLFKPGEWFEIEAFAEVDHRESRRIDTQGRVRHIHTLTRSADSLPTEALPELQSLSDLSYPTNLGRPYLPIGYAGILVIALVAVIGFAAFSGSP